MLVKFCHLVMLVISLQLEGKVTKYICITYDLKREHEMSLSAGLFKTQGAADLINNKRAFMSKFAKKSTIPKRIEFKSKFLQIRFCLGLNQF